MRLAYINESTDTYLKNLLEKLKVKDFKIIRKKDLPYFLLNHKNINNYIINLDDNGPGTHWTALNTKKKVYFDSFGLHPPNEIPSNYKYYNNIIEGIDDNDCGQLSALFLYYVNHKNIKDFFNLFNKLYK